MYVKDTIGPAKHSKKFKFQNYSFSSL